MAIVGKCDFWTKLLTKAYTVCSNSPGHDFERFAEALTVQGHAPELTTAGDEVTLRVKGSPSTAPEPTDDQTAREYRAAEMQWLSDPGQDSTDPGQDSTDRGQDSTDRGQDSTDREFEAAERSWLA